MAGCVFPDGVSVNTDYVTCTTDGASNCCHRNDKCRENGFCLSVVNGYHYRGGCTDASYKSPSCPTTCTDNAAGNKTFVNIIACDAAQNGGTWCCAYKGNCCGDETFRPNWGRLFTPSGVAEDLSPSKPDEQASPSGSLGSSSSLSSSSPDGRNAPKNQTTDEGKESSAGGSNTAAVAVGASLGSILLLVGVALAVVFWRRRRKQQVPSTYGTSQWTETQTPISPSLGPYKEQPLVAEVTAERPRHELPTS